MGLAENRNPKVAGRRAGKASPHQLTRMLPGHRRGNQVCPPQTRSMVSPQRRASQLLGQRSLRQSQQGSQRPLPHSQTWTPKSLEHMGSGLSPGSNSTGCVAWEDHIYHLSVCFSSASSRAIIKRPRLPTQTLNTYLAHSKRLLNSYFYVG